MKDFMNFLIKRNDIFNYSFLCFLSGFPSYKQPPRDHGLDGVLILPNSFNYEEVFMKRNDNFN